MFKITRKEIDWGGRKLVLESGRIARQADGAVLATFGENVVLATAVANRAVKPGQDFFPLTVNYQEKQFAAGKIPGGFFKREGRPTEKEVLTSRLIDRPIRPLFPDGFRNETQVIVTVLAHDGENDPDILAMIAASAALTISGVPFLGPIAGARIGYKNGEFLLNPKIEDTRASDLDLIVAGTRDAVMMVESEARELPEDTMLSAVMFGHRQFQPVIDLIIDLAQTCAKEPWTLDIPEHKELYGRLKEASAAELREAYGEPMKQLRQEKVGAVKAKALQALVEPDTTPAATVSAQFKELESEVVRGQILDTGRRIDGRDVRTVRPIEAAVGILPRVHGSALFTRGETQALVVATLGTGQDEQMIDALEGDMREHYLPALQLPAVLGRRDRPDGLAGPARGRARQARLARHPPAAADQGELPLHDPGGLRGHREQRLVLDGHGLRRLAGADGRGRAHAAAGGRHRHGPDQGGRAVRGALRHPGRRGPPRRHGLQGRRHRGGRHLAADGHQDRRHHRGDHAHRAPPGARGADPHPGRDGRARWASRGPRCARPCPG
jgi:polyribonucleotide nucleotidyltransferase